MKDPKMEEDKEPSGLDSNINSESILQRDAYFKSLRSWIQETEMIQNIQTCLPFYFMHIQGNTGINGASNPLLNNNIPQPNFNQFLPNNFAANPRNLIPDQNIGERATILRNGGYEYIIPPLYKRLLAETIDFILMFFVKLIATLVAVDYFGLIDLEKFDIEVLAKNFSDEDYQTAIEMMQEIIVVEISYRIVACIYEAQCISFGFWGGRQNGATPGKALLGLKVVHATAIVNVRNRPQETVIIYPGTRVTFWRALARSVLKNLLISLLFPVCLGLFIYPHNRVCYDCVCSVIVVEDSTPQRRNRRR